MVKHPASRARSNLAYKAKTIQFIRGSKPYPYVLSATESKGRTYKYSEDSAPNHPAPLSIYQRDREVRKRWFNIQDHAVVFDVGAEYGHWSLCALAQGAHMVYAIEPDRDYQLMLKININNNTAYNERCGIIKRDIKLDQFVDHLSCAPPSINFIRLGERYTSKAAFANVIKHSINTITLYKPSIIACFERNGGYLPFIAGITALGMEFNHRQFTNNGDEYTLVTFA